MYPILEKENIEATVKLGLCVIFVRGIVKTYMTYNNKHFIFVSKYPVLNVLKYLKTWLIKLKRPCNKIIFSTCNKKFKKKKTCLKHQIMKNIIIFYLYKFMSKIDHWEGLG